jgi:uncharacterized protein YecE (DUF72 family)
VVKGAHRLAPHLGPLLFQLPPNFRRTDENVRRLASFLELLPHGLLTAFEFRERSWFDDSTFSLLRRHRVAFCSHDMPQLGCPLLVTAGFAYVRFHGAGARYQGKYGRPALGRWADRLRELASDVNDVYVYFNNDALAHAVADAGLLSEMLSANRLEPAAAHPTD